MPKWTAKVFVNSQVGTINTEVEAATFSGAQQQIFAKHGDVQQITNLRQVNENKPYQSSEISTGGTAALLGLAVVAWIFISFTPWILMVAGGAFGTWVGQLVTGQTVEEYADSDSDTGHGKIAITLVLAIILGGFGFIQGNEIKKGFDSPSTPPKTQTLK